MSADIESRESADFTNSGYFGPAHRDASIAKERSELKPFIARFKHALLFTPKLVIADHMVFSPNFQAAYRADAQFRQMLREDLVQLAHFEKFANGRAFTLVECRKFFEYLRQGQNPRFNPLEPSCPSDPFDDELEAIQQNVGRRFPESSRRDLLFTQFADREIELEALAGDLGGLWAIYRTAYDRLRHDVQAQGYPLGIIHFDEVHRSSGTENIFDYMARVSSLPSGMRNRIVKEVGERIARSHRALLLKAEMQLMTGTHAILPTDLAPYRSIVFNKPNAESIDERNANIRESKIDLSAISATSLSSLSLDKVLELRRSGQELFDIMEDYAHKPDSFDMIWKCLDGYCRRINSALGAGQQQMATGSRSGNFIRLIQGGLAGQTGLRDVGVAMIFKVAGAIAHSQTAVQTGFAEAGSAIDVPLQRAEAAVRSAIAPKPLVSLIKDVKAHISLQTVGNREQLMYYE
jgi:hypothetical protein